MTQLRLRYVGDDSVSTSAETDLGFARQFYADGRFDFDEFEHAIDVILAGGSIHDVAQLDLPAPPAGSER